MAEESTKQYAMTYKGNLKGHNGWVTTMQLGNSGSKEFLITGSRDKSMLIWDVNNEMDERDELGKPKKMLRGHSHFIQELALSNDSSHCVSASWDGFVRMWDLNEGRSTKVFKGHKKDVLSVAFSSDNRQIISAGRDKSIMLWNTLGEAKHSVADAHNEWVSSVKFSPDNKQNIFFSIGWDRKIKVWDKNMSEYAPKQQINHSTHSLNALAVAPSGAFIASGGKDRTLKIWSVLPEAESGYGLKLVREEDLNSDVNALAFSPNYFWVACGCEDSIKLYDFNSQKIISTITMEPLDMKQEEPEEEKDDKEKEKEKKAKKPRPKIGVLSMCMNPKGDMLYAGCTDNVIRVYELKEQEA